MGKARDTGPLSGPQVSAVGINTCRRSFALSPVQFCFCKMAVSFVLLMHCFSALKAQKRWRTITLMLPFLAVSALQLKSCQCVKVYCTHTYLCICYVVLCQLDRVTRTQLQQFIETCVHKFMRARIEPGAETGMPAVLYLH